MNVFLGCLKNNAEAPKSKSNMAFLQALARLIVLENSPVTEDVAQAILKTLIPMASSALAAPNESMAFAELLSVMSTLASAGSGSGHIKLFRSSNEWLEICKTYLVQKNVIEKLEIGNNVGKHRSMVENACNLLNYLGDILNSIQLSLDGEQSSSMRPLSPFEGDGGAGANDVESDWNDDVMLQDDDDSAAGEDSDDDSLCNKLCTYTQTQKEFFNQHWYHCHTCKMVDGIGVCSICAKVCHADHDVTYSKFGSFFCDCGAKEDGSCAAMTKRTAVPSAHYDEARDERDARAVGASGSGYEPASSLRKREGPISTAQTSSKENTDPDGAERTKSAAKLALAKKLSLYKDVLLDTFQHASVALDVLHLMYSLVPVMEANSDKYTSVGKLERLRSALRVLHSAETPKAMEISEQLTNPTLGSQEGAFENVRMNYSGDQGQQIRQLLTAHMVRRVVMCCLSSGPNGKRQHLAVAHEKGRITVLQLSALLRQADSAQKKLTLTRLTSAPVPFTVLSVVADTVNEDYLAVTGLKDCHVLTLSSSGNVAEHLVLHPQLDANNFIIKVKSHHKVLHLI